MSVYKRQGIYEGYGIYKSSGIHAKPGIYKTGVYVDLGTLTMLVDDEEEPMEGLVDDETVEFEGLKIV